MSRLGQHAPDGGVEVPTDDYLDDTVVVIPCYEPSGQQIAIDGRALCTHTLIIGQTGCGKTTSSFRWYLKHLIGHGRKQEEMRPGVFVFDFNADDTVPLVIKWAQEFGRSDDLRLLTSDVGHLDLFTHVRTLEDIPAATAQFFLGTWSDDSNNSYWHETTRTLIDAALSICFLVHGRLDTDIVLKFLTNWLVARRPSLDDETLLAGFDAMAAAAHEHVGPALLGKIEHVRATVGMWHKLDSRTKGILNSCLLDALGPLMSLETRRYLDQAKGESFAPEDVVSGKIMVFSLPAGRSLESASLLGRIVKSRLYVALQERPPGRRQRLCSILSDEYHYLASGGVDRSSDVTALATLRSRNVALIAATQSLDHLASVMRPSAFRSLLPNFGCHFFFRSTEASTSAFATDVMGMRERIVSTEEDQGSLRIASPMSTRWEYVCPSGALARLESGQAYVATSTGFRSNGMVWLAGNYETGAPALPGCSQPSSDPLENLREAVLPKSRNSTSPVNCGTIESGEAPPNEPSGKQTSAMFYAADAWHRLVREPRFLRAPYPNFHGFRQRFLNRGHTPDGLETIPVCWWAALTRLVIPFCHQYHATVSLLRQHDGCIQIKFAQNLTPSDMHFGCLATLQKSLYPIRTRRLKPRDFQFLATCSREEEIPY